MIAHAITKSSVVSCSIRARIRARHRDGLVPSTKGKHARLVYFKTYEGEKARVTERENELTLRNLDGLGRRRLREMVENFQAPLRLVDLNA